jgi:hypothetical protein
VPPTPVPAETVSLPDSAPTLLGRARSLSTAEARARAEILVFFAVSRLLVLGSAAFVDLTGFPKPSAGSAFAHRPFALLEVWDGQWYRTVATHGYLLLPGRQSDPAFFPLLPILLRLLHPLGLSYPTAGILVSNLAFGVGLLAFYELGRIWGPETIARRAAIYAAIFPMGFVFSMLYPEALAFAFIALAGLFAARRRWGRTAGFAALAVLARPEGLLVIVPICASAVRSWQTMPTASRGRALAAVLAPVAALIGYSGYLWWLLAEPFAWTKAQLAWGRSFHVTGIYGAVTELSSALRHNDGWLFRDAAFCLVYLLCLVAAWRAGVPRAWIAAGAGMVLLPLTSGSFTSDARFGLLALPVYTGLAWIGRNRTVDVLIRIASIVLLVAGVETLLLHWP